MLKKIIISLMPMALCALSAVCQTASLSGIRQLPLPEGSARPVLSPDGGTLLFSTPDGTSLQSFDMDNSVIQTLDNSIAAGIAPVFSNDSKKVIYRTAEVKDKLMYRDVREVELFSGKVKVTEKMSRKPMSLKALPESDYAFADYDRICISRNGKVTELKPIEDAYSYVDAHLSPDGKKIIFIEAFKGLFVCDIDGSNLRNIAAHITDAAWVDNNSVVFVVSHDDGYIVLTSAMIYYNLETDKWTTLTGDDIMPAEVTASGADSTIVFATYSGEVYSAKLVTE